MRVKRYWASSVPEAAARIKADLGHDAVILQTKPARRGGFLGLFGPRLVEVVAAADGTAAAPPRPRPEPRPPLPAGLLGSGGAVALERVQSDVAHLKDALADLTWRLELTGGGRSQPELRSAYQRLVGQGMAGELALKLLQRLQAEVPGVSLGAPAADLILRDLCRRDLGDAATLTAVPGRRCIAALVGPTGVGKTTTLAKLAAGLSLQRQLRVAVFTADTYRIAAVDQLRTYCDIMGMPLEVVPEPGDVAAALSRHADADVVLVDTAGRSHRNPDQMQGLGRYLQALGATEVYLVVSLTAGAADADAVADAYAALGYDRFLFTKLDEAVTPGVAYNLIRRWQRPASYITTGQNVPDDIAVADADRLASLVLGDRE